MLCSGSNHDPAFWCLTRCIWMLDLTARLAMRAVVVEEGIPLKGGDKLDWHRLLQRTWREMEEHYWEQTYSLSIVDDA